MTKSRDKRKIDVPATVRNAIQEAEKLIRERVLRELRYHPGFCGDITVTLRIRNGIPFACKQNVEDSLLIEPVD